jgi:hypothetical protein
MDMVIGGDILAFAGDMLILTKSKPEITKAILELESLSWVWKLRFY